MKVCSISITNLKTGEVINTTGRFSKQCYTVYFNAFGLNFRQYWYKIEDQLYIFRNDKGKFKVIGHR